MLVSVIEVTTALRVRLRERLWEDAGKVDLTALVAYALGCLAFGYGLYAAAGVSRFSIGVGLMGALGHSLSADLSRFWPMHQSYVVTTPNDLVARRDIVTADVESTEARASVAKGMVGELAWYFGYTLKDEVFDAHLNVARQYVGGV